MRRRTGHIDGDEAASRLWIDGKGAADWVEELPWQPVRAGEAAGLVASYRRAQMVAAELRSALIAAGVDPRELGGLCPSVDETGRPVVILGQVSAETAELLVVLLGRASAA